MGSPCSPRVDMQRRPSRRSRRFSRRPSRRSRRFSRRPSRRSRRFSRRPWRLSMPAVWASASDTVNSVGASKPNAAPSTGSETTFRRDIFSMTVFHSCRKPSSFSTLSPTLGAKRPPPRVWGIRTRDHMGHAIYSIEVDQPVPVPHEWGSSVRRVKARPVARSVYYPTVFNFVARSVN